MRTLIVLALLAIVAPTVSAPAEAAAGPRRHLRRLRSITVHATAYCQRGVTASGERTRRGIVAADPRVLPFGTVIGIDDRRSPYRGTYTVADVGDLVKGRRIDIFTPSCSEAIQFGRRAVTVTVLGD